MDSVIRAAVVYGVLLLMFRLTGKRALGQITTFDAVLVLIISEALQQALISRDDSMTNAFLLVLTLLGLEVFLSVVTFRSRRLDKLLNDVPLLLVSDGALLHDRLAKARISEDDILEKARMLWGIEQMDQVRFAMLERNGEISIVPSWVPWMQAPRAAAGAAKG